MRRSVYNGNPARFSEIVVARRPLGDGRFEEDVVQVSTRYGEVERFTRTVRRPDPEEEAP